MSILTVAEGETREVTPDNPLVINETEVTFTDVVIKGGEIIVNVQTVATFKKLEKVS